MSKNEVHPITLEFPCSPNDKVYVVLLDDNTGRPLYIMPDIVKEIKYKASDNPNEYGGPIVIKTDSRYFSEFSLGMTAFITIEEAADGYDRLMKIYELNNAPKVEDIPVPVDEPKKKGKKKK